ncbi:hypothetical protein F4859DRAFT_230330 [Xylaria cf. heliscus]|nr:hypothetical protein F4859DRAFT_230330 [Xylaria cf. heliscus]
MSWTITAINANNDFPVVTSTGVTIPSGPQRVWLRGANYNDGQDGSTRPNVFHNTMNPRTEYFRVTVSGTANYSPSWRRLRYSIVGYLGFSPVLTSGLVNIPATGNVVQVTGLFLKSPDFATRRVSIPFRHSGDFTWRIWVWGPDGRTVGSMTADKSTRLEFVWARTRAPNGPLNPRTTTVRSRVDMDPGYPILLFRLFAPSPRELPVMPAQDVMFYIQRAVGVVWSPNLSSPRYDTMQGRAQYVYSGFGGWFKLREYYNRTYPTCNCYDMAGICQLALSLLMDASGNELADSHWVYQSPNGFINPGPLIRWVTAGGDHLRCNTPFWASAGTRPYVAPNAANRTSFGNHAWVEITLNGVTTVVDATHALQSPAPIPPNGTLSREQYITATLDQSKPHGNATAKTTSNPYGNCSLNPVTQLERIGVYNPWGRFPRASNMVDLVPEPLRDEIAALVEKARTPGATDPLFANVDVLGVAHAIARHIGLTLADESTTTANPASTHTTSIYRHGSGATAIVTIDAFSNFEGPMNALIVHLTGYQAGPLSSIVHSEEPNLGEYSLGTANSKFWIRGNLFVHAQWFAAPSEGEEVTPLGADIDIVGLAAALDADLARAPLLGDPPHAINLVVEGGSTSLVQHGPALVVTVPNNERFASLMSFTDNNDVLVPRGPPDEESKLLFYPRAEGTAEVKIVGAAKGSLRPFQTTISVTVSPGGVIAVQDEEAVPEPPPFVPSLPEE